MARRSTCQFKIDDLAYPIRVKFVVPEGGLMALDVDLHAWLGENLDYLAWAWGPAHSTGCWQATAYYFRAMADAQRFIDAFPQLELADGVALSVYTSPTKTAEPTRSTSRAHAIGCGGRQKS